MFLPRPDLSHRLALPSTASSAMTFAVVPAMCPAFGGANAVFAAWQAIYAQARADAERQVASERFWRAIEPSMN